VKRAVVIALCGLGLSACTPLPGVLRQLDAPTPAYPAYPAGPGHVAHTDVDYGYGPGCSEWDREQPEVDVSGRLCRWPQLP
jgi:hypothetical protein